MIVCRPRDAEGGPLLRDCPLWTEETRPVEMLIFLNNIIIGYPEKLQSQYDQQYFETHGNILRHSQICALISPSIAVSIVLTHHSKLHSILSCPRGSLHLSAQIHASIEGVDIPQTK